MATEPDIQPAHAAPSIPRLEDTFINGWRPFSEHWTATDIWLGQAHALLTMFEQAYRVSAQAPGTADELHSINDNVQASAFAGIATLIALAQHSLDVADAEQEGR